MDIETIEINSHQTPITFSLAQGDNENNLFLIVYNKNINEAVNILWKDVFNFIQNNHSQIKTIFIHNLGSFDGYFIYKALSNIIDQTNISTIIDPQNKFIRNVW